MKKTQSKNTKTAIAVGAGLAAIAAAAAGVYYMTGKNAKNRKKLGKWADSMQKDIIRELHLAGKNTQSAYNKAVDTVTKNYKGLKNISTGDLAMTAAELKSSWDLIKAEMDRANTTIRRVVPKAVKSAPRKVKVKTVKRVAKQAIKKATKKVAKKRSR